MTLEYQDLMEDIKNERVNHPSHYIWLKEKCGIEVIDITRHMGFNLGNVIKYILRAGKKSEEGVSLEAKSLEDLKKAEWYLHDEIAKQEHCTEANYINNTNNYHSVLHDLETAINTKDENKIKEYLSLLKQFSVFYLDKEEHDKAWEIIRKYRNSSSAGAIGGDYNLIFTPTSLGTTINIEIDGKKEVIRDSSDW